MLRVVCFVSACVLSFACGGRRSSGPPGDADPGVHDGGRPTSDAGERDAGGATDADVAPTDAGPRDDAGGPDAGPRGTRASCADCTATRDCQDGTSCIRLTSGIAWCLPLERDAPGGDCRNMRVYRSVDTARTAEGMNERVCFPMELCPAYRNYMRSCHATGVTCLERLGGEGVCWARSGSAFVCTVNCLEDLDCPEGAVCSLEFGSPGYCVW